MQRTAPTKSATWTSPRAESVRISKVVWQFNRTQSSDLPGYKSRRKREPNNDISRFGQDQTHACTQCATIRVLFSTIAQPEPCGTRSDVNRRRTVGLDAFGHLNRFHNASLNRSFRTSWSEIGSEVGEMGEFRRVCRARSSLFLRNGHVTDQMANWGEVNSRNVGATSGMNLARRSRVFDSQRLISRTVSIVGDAELTGFR